MSDRDWKSGLPGEYAKEKLERLQKRWRDELGGHLRAMTPIAWPGVPATVFLGFTSFARGTENTTEATPRQRFHELGYFQIEAGLREGPAPNPDPRAEYNAWGALAGAELVVRLLGRPATMKPDGWRHAVADQTAVGLTNLRRHLGNARRKLPESLHPQDPASTWAVLLAFTAFSRGAGQLARVLDPYVEALAGVPERERWSAWEAMVAEDVARDAPGTGGQDGRRGAAYAIIRSRQKCDSGLLAARSLGEPTDWYVRGDAARDEALARSAYEAEEGTRDLSFSPNDDDLRDPWAYEHVLADVGDPGGAR